jgi:hypothetical protein
VETFFGTLGRVSLREGWKDEARDFTPWLAENLERLGEQIGLALELRENEHAVGRYSLDLLAEDVTGRIVIIENQLEPSDHTHLGQLLTYCAGTDARVVVWVAPSFTPEHLAALEWLNQNTNVDVGFFAVEIELLRIGDSPMAPNFRTVLRPNQWVKETRPVIAQQGEWNWERYAVEMRIPLERLTVAKRLVEGVSAAIADQHAWQPMYRKGYVAFQRAGGYNVLRVDMFGEFTRLFVKLPSPPSELELDHLFPELQSVALEEYREWGWRIPTIDAIPDLDRVVEVAAKFNTQPKAD